MLDQGHFEFLFTTCGKQDLQVGSPVPIEIAAFSSARNKMIPEPRRVDMQYNTSPSGGAHALDDGHSHGWID